MKGVYLLDKMKKAKVFITNREKYIFGMFLSIFIMSIGILFNFIAIVENGGKMPVYVNHDLKGRIETEEHFYYNDKSEIEYSHLSDIIPFKFNGEKYKASIGDVVMVLSLVSLVIFSFLYTRRLVRKEP